MSDTSQQLARAYELILRDQVDAAYNIIKPITDAEPNNTDAWWLLANATADPSQARRALITVLKLNPAHPKARPLLDKLNEMNPPRDDEIMQMMAIEEVDPAMPSDTSANFVDDPFDDDDDDLFGTIAETPAPKKARAKPQTEIDDLFSDVDEDDDPFAALLDEDDDLELGELANAKPRSRRRRLVWMLLLVFLCLCLAVAATFALNGGSEDTSTPVAAEWTTVTADVVNVESSSDLQQTAEAVQISAQSGLGGEAEAYYVQLPDSAFALIVGVCADPSPELPSLVQSSMDFIARDVANRTLLEPHIAQVGLVIRDCTRQDDILYRVLSPWSAARDYSLAIGDSQAFSNFRQTWTVDS